jgi:hypothetical protein
MHRLLFWILVLTVSIPVLAQPKHPVLFRSKSISNDVLVTIPGTNVKILPPTGFLISERFTGLQNGASLIEVYDLPGGSYNVISGDFTMEKFGAQNLEILSFEEVEVGQYRGRLISLQTDVHQKGMTLVFGNESFSVIVVANFPAGDIGLGVAIRNSILGMQYDTVTETDPLAHAIFKMKDTESEFRYRKKSANTFYFLESENNRSSYLTVTQLAWDYSTTPATIASLMLDEMKKYGMANTDIKRASRKNVNGYQAFESEIYATRNGERCLVYQMVMVHNERALVVNGIGNSDFRKNRSAFRRMAHSIEFK